MLINFINLPSIPSPSLVIGRRGARSVLETEISELRYRPKTRETRAAYEQLLSEVQAKLGDQPQDVLLGCGDEVLSLLKDQRLTDPRRLAQLESLLGALNVEEFARLVRLGKAVVDYAVANGDEVLGGGEMALGEDGLDDAKEIAVVFDEGSSDEDDQLVVVVGDSCDEEADEEAAGLADTDASQRLALARQGSDDRADAEHEQEEEEESGDGGGAMDERDDEGSLGGGAASAEGDAVKGGVAGVLQVRHVDGFWLQRQLAKFYKEDSLEAQQMSGRVLQVLRLEEERECENQLVQLLDYHRFDFIKLLLRNRALVLYCTLHGQAQGDEERAEVEASMEADPTAAGLLAALRGDSKAQELERSIRAEARRMARSSRRGKANASSGASESSSTSSSTSSSSSSTQKSQQQQQQKVLDLDSLRFGDGAQLNSSGACELPPGSFRKPHKGYEEVHVPAVKAPPYGDSERLVPISELPEWAQSPFAGMKSLNRVQSRLYEAAFQTHENLLLCAPTGAGKTNVALLTILHEVGLNMREDGTLDLEGFKIVYVAPMKSLVQEMVGNFGKRLGALGITVNELSGDQNLTRQQIHDTQVIVTTPEKWDIVTRKSGDRTYTQLVRLIIFDEIHLLHDARGPVIESIVARTIRQIESTQEMVRLVGLSATLPNYEDVATFLLVDQERGLFAFDNSYRPVPLEQTYVGITERNSFKRFQLMNQITYEKVLEHAGRNLVLVFVHSRKETARTARAIRDAALANDTIGRFLKEDSYSREILQQEAEESAKDAVLRDLLPYGFACHHAGMSRADRTLVEDLFADNHIQVLVSTATLAWGVNLPAHTVIIKGTQVYSPERGRWVELSPLDVGQMMGRAGRPQYDSKGEGIIITSHRELQYYLSLLNHQLPIESQFVSRLADNLNAELVLGTVQSVADAVNWLGYTYLYICMLRSPQLYGVGADEAQRDPELRQRLRDLVHTAATLLDRAKLAQYDRKSGALQVTDLGRVASHYYVEHRSMATFNEHLKRHMGDIELFRLFSLSGEFRQLTVRDEEKGELEKLLDRVPIPVKETVEDPAAKVNVLLQTHISRLRLDGFALVADMVYVTQSAGRIMRALFEVVLHRGWARLTAKTLALCQMIERRMWVSQSPLRQFRGIPEAIVRKIERKDFSFERLYDLTSQEIGELIHFPSQGKAVYRYVHQFPRLDLSCHVQPISRSLLRVELEITPDFEWSEKHHGVAEGFWVLVEDTDGEVLLHHEYFLLKRKYATAPHYVDFTVPLFEPLPPQYFVRVLSDRWLGSESVLPISFRSLLLPAKYAPPTELLDLQPLPVRALAEPRFEALYEQRGLRFFNAVQTQVFQTAYASDHNMLLCAPTGSGKQVVAEFALLRMLAQHRQLQSTTTTTSTQNTVAAGERARAVYVVPKTEVAEARAAEWAARLGVSPAQGGLGLSVVLLTGEPTADLRLLDRGDLVVSTPQHWDMLSRRWKQRKNVQRVRLFVADELHLVGGEDGHVLEAVVSRMRYIAAQTERPIRVLGLAESVANARDLGEWLGVPSQALFAFHPHVRPTPLEVHLRGFDQPNFQARTLAMYRPALRVVARHAASAQPTLVFVSERREAVRFAEAVRRDAVAAGQPQRHLFCEPSDLQPFLARVRNPRLTDLLQHGVAYLSDTASAAEIAIVTQVCMVLVV
jgi:pre-mRNA-splicing helicase BRR2